VTGPPVPPPPPALPDCLVRAFKVRGRVDFSHGVGIFLFPASSPVLRFFFLPV